MKSPVFGLSIIVPIRSDGVSRDCLIEQILPVRVWGKNAFLVPYVQPAGIRREGDDLYRVLAAYDNTELFINNNKIVTLDRGGYYEGTLNAAAMVTSNNPILVAQYKKTGSNNSMDHQLSDPFMMIIPPMEQFMNTYRVINVQIYEYFFGTGIAPVYQMQYIIIVSPDNNLGNIRMDGQPVNQGLFRSIPNSSYSYANILVKDGVHEIKSKGDIGVYVYGYGIANSYGYVGGMSFKPLDFRPPEIYGVDSCFTLNGVAMDTAMNDSRISRLDVPIDSSKNVNVQIEGFQPYKPQVRFTARLNNFRKDGKFTLVAQDSIGLKSQKSFDIPGFTLSLTQRELNDSIPTIEDSTVANKSICFEVQIHNYGKFDQVIERLKLANSSFFKYDYTIPRTLKPGQIDTIQICFSNSADTLVIDSLLLESPCYTQNLMNLIMKVSTDKKPPEIARNSDTCFSPIAISITDSSGTDIGIASVDTVNIRNCSLDFQSKSSKIYKFTIRIIDPYQDAWYTVNAVDAAGNKSSVHDTIPGFTLSFPDWSQDSVRKIDFKTNMLGSFLCDSFKVFNYGNFPIKFDNFLLSKNILYSMPQSQFPLIIQPLETKTLYVCFRPFEVEKKPSGDTIHIWWKDCFQQKILLTGNGVGDEYTGLTSCGIVIKMTSNKVPYKFMINPIYPNPLIDKGTISFELPEPNSMKIDIFNTFGSHRLKVADENFNEGSYQVTFDTNALESGMYICMIRTNTGIYTRYFLITR